MCRGGGWRVGASEHEKGMTKSTICFSFYSSGSNIKAPVPYKTYLCFLTYCIHKTKLYRPTLIITIKA